MQYITLFNGRAAFYEVLADILGASLYKAAAFVAKKSLELQDEQIFQYKWSRTCH